MENIEYQEIQIKKVLAEMVTTFYNLQSYKDYYPIPHDDYDAQESIAMNESDFAFYARKLKLLCVVYFEEKGNKRFLEILEKAIEPFYIDAKSLRKGTADDGDYVTSDLIQTFRDHLSVFSAFSDNNAEILKRTGLVYLEHILESTAVIINKLEKKPKTETEVYKAVEIVCQATFSNAQFLSFSYQTSINQPSFPIDEFFTDSFQKSDKCYKPDILIPSLHCAIEYKYAENKNKLTDTIEQILIDVEGYRNHHTYKVFYAVFYVKAGISTRKTFNEIWKEKGFPANWKGIMVEASM